MWCETRAIINDDNDNEKEYWFGRLGDETVHIDFEERFWYSFRFNNGTMLSLNEKKIQYS